MEPLLSDKTLDSSSSPSSTASNIDATTDWFVRSLTCLGYANPRELLPAILDGSDETQLMELTLWLEESVIRLWSLEQRDELRNHYANVIASYLEALECPVCYYSASDWQSDQRLRTRVVFWLLSVATSQAYEFAFVEHDDGNSETDNASAVLRLEAVSITDETTKRKASEIFINESLANLSASDLAALPCEDFPLGFSTGDEEVDKILTLLRMNLLLDLEQEQQEINRRIAQLQTLTVPGAKALKKFKQRRKNK